MDTYVYCAIAYLIQEPFNKVICEASKNLEISCGSWFVLNETLFPPHLTLWIAYVPEKNVPSIINMVQKLSTTIEPFVVNSKSINTQDNGYISLEIENNNKLRQLHLNLLKKLNKYREGYIPEKYQKNWENLPIDHKKSIEKFGTRLAGPYFNPHLTIGVIKKECLKASYQYLPYNLEFNELTINKLTFFKQANEGKSVEILSNFNL